MHSLDTVKQTVIIQDRLGTAILQGIVFSEVKRPNRLDNRVILQNVIIKLPIIGNKLQKTEIQKTKQSKTENDKQSKY